MNTKQYGVPNSFQEAKAATQRSPASSSDSTWVDEDAARTLQSGSVPQPKQAAALQNSSASGRDASLSSGPPQVLIDDEIYYRVEGDLLLDMDEFDLYREQQAAEQELAKLATSNRFTGVRIMELVAQTSELVGMMANGKLVRWAPGTVLTYCVLKHTFPREEWYEEVVDNMQTATAAWEATCGVEFEYRADLDNAASLRPDGVVFPVRYIAAGGAFIAASFFPTDPVNRRRMLIDPSYFTTRFNHVGVLRHELGHVLGFRHEHIRSGAPRTCPDEDVTDTVDLTQYDPQSVMHYFCGGVGSRDLSITEVDRTGAQLVYGPPLARFQLLEP